MQKITRAISRSYRSLYGPAEKAHRRAMLRFINLNEDKILRKAYSVFRQVLVKSLGSSILIQKDIADAEFQNYITEDLDGDLRLDPVTLTFMDESAQSVLKVLGEELVLFDTGAVTVEWARLRGFRLAKGLSTSMGDSLRSQFVEGLSLNESPMVLKERLRAKLTNYKEYELNRLARSESISALNEGVLESLRASPSLNGKEWIAHAGACIVCQGLDGTKVYIDETFDGGFDRPTAHPNCRCTIGGARLPKKDTKK